VERRLIAPRPDWREKVEALGLVFHTTESPPAPGPNDPGGSGATPAAVPYWNEAAYYAFSVNDVDRIERATNELHERCLEAVQHVIDQRLYARLGIPASAVPAIERSWEADPPSLYGRFDLAYDGAGPPLMLEYNADTPTSLYEAAVVQWKWLEECFPGRDQFNSLHERLIASWADLRPRLHGFKSPGGPVVHFAHVDDVEDLVTVTYLRDTATQAGLRTVGLHVADVGFDQTAREFVDLDDQAITNLFKLYPWEWAAGEEFGPLLLEPPTPLHVIEPAWKMVLSNKGILAVLWELFEGHPNLLPAALDRPTDEMETWGYVRKPLLSREGANVTIVRGRGQGTDADTPGDYGAEGFVYQAPAPMPAHDAGDGTVRRAVVGSWVIGQEAGGMGVRETAGLVTDNRSQFVPHVIDAWFDPEQYDVLREGEPNG
jgi:glutathionylspermidine synthase